MKRIVNWVVSLFRRGKTKYEVDEESYVAGGKEHFHRETTVDKLIVSEALRLREAARSYSVMVYTPEKRSSSTRVSITLWGLKTCTTSSSGSSPKESDSRFRQM